MKKIFAVMAFALIIWSCQEKETVKKDNDYTGNESTYALQAGSTYPISGTVTFKEHVDGTAQIVVQISGTEGTSRFPVHLHMGDISTDAASLAALLNPVLGSTGASETHLTNLADESTITYKQLVALNACVKIHLSDAGPDQNIILAAGNIGTAAAKNSSTGRLGIGICKSE